MKEASACAAAQAMLVADYRQGTRGAPDDRQKVLFLWRLGRGLLEHSPGQFGPGGRWAGGALTALSEALGKRFPDLRLAPRSLLRIQGFAEAWRDEAIVRRLLCHLSWQNNVVLLSELSDPGRRVWYGLRAVEAGWTTPDLEEEIEGDLFGEGCQLVARQGRKRRHDWIPPWERPAASGALPGSGPPRGSSTASRSGRAMESTDHPTGFGLGQSLALQVLDAFVRPGRNFTYLGMELPLRGRFFKRRPPGRYQVDDSAFDMIDEQIDLLLHQIKLQRHMVIRLSQRDPTTADGERLHMVLSGIDELFNSYWDRQSIGLWVASTDDSLRVHYALPEDAGALVTSRDGLTRGLPRGLQKLLPTPEKLEAELMKRMRRAR